LNIAFSPDGEYFAASPDRYALKIWSLRNGKLMQTIRTSFTGAVNSLAFAPNGLSIATGHYDGEIRVWNTLTGELILSLQTPGVVESLAFSSDGTVLASGHSYDDRAVRLWDIQVGHLQRELTGHSSGVEKLAFSPDGSLLATGSYDGTVVIWGVRP
jgi:WD40 repeat protein